MSLKARPPSYGKQSVTPYYRQEYAEKLKPVLDALIADPDKDIIIEYSDVKRSTLKLRIYQAWQWLIDNADPDGVYAKLKDTTYKLKEFKHFRITTKKSTVEDFEFTKTPQAGRKNLQGREAERYSWNRDRLLEFIKTSNMGDVYDINEQLNTAARFEINQLIEENPKFAVLSISKLGAKIGRIDE